MFLLSYYFSSFDIFIYTLFGFPGMTRDKWPRDSSWHQKKNDSLEISIEQCLKVIFSWQTRVDQGKHDANDPGYFEMRRCFGLDANGHSHSCALDEECGAAPACREFDYNLIHSIFEIPKNFFSK